VTLAADVRRTFPLVPRRRLIGLPFGDLPSRRRGHGADIIGARPYQPGDPITSIDWFASARASSATGGDEFIVREHAADEAPRVVIVLDRRPAMRLYPQPLPWLAKHVALREAAAAIAASAAAARADLAVLHFGDGEPSWLPPGRLDRAWQILDDDAAFDAPEDSIDRALTFLGEHRASLPAATFVFVLSDFLAPPVPAAWHDALAHGWDIVPVVIQDPVWEQSFPDIGGVAVPVADPRSGNDALVRLSGRQARRRRDANERRHGLLLAELESFGLETIEIASSDGPAVDSAFITWAEDRRRQRWAR
jgi:uncharacterized protein (DUF58 family)